MIEAAIIVTRFKLTKDEREKEEMKKLMERYKEIVKKCGGHREKEAIEILQKKCAFQ